MTRAQSKASTVAGVKSHLFPPPTTGTAPASSCRIVAVRPARGGIEGELSVFFAICFFAVASASRTPHPAPPFYAELTSAADTEMVPKQGGDHDGELHIV